MYLLLVSQIGSFFRDNLSLIQFLFYFYRIGSWDGVIRLWKIDEKVRSFSALTTISTVGYINSLQLISPTLRSSAPQSSREEQSSTCKSLVVVASVGKEPRLGRWMKIKEGKEGAVVAVIALK